VTGGVPPTALAVAVTCFAAGFFGRGLVESFIVFVLPLGEEFGWDRATVVSIYSFSVLASGVAGPLVGRLFDRAGPRAVYLLGLALLAGGFSAAPYLTSLWQFQLFLGFATGLAASCLGNVPTSALLGRWFRKRLALATSIVFSSLGIGILVLVPLTQTLIDSYGWRGAYQVLGGIALGLILPALLLPWKRFSAGNPDLRRGAGAASGEIESVTLVRALLLPSFWGLFTIFFFTSVAMFALTAQIIAYLVEVGFSPIQAATAWGFTGILMPIGMIAVGWLDAAIGRRPSILISFGSSFAGLCLLWLLARFPNVWLLGAFIVAFGGMLGSRGPLLATMAFRLFQGPAAATIFGAINVGNGLGAAFGSWMGGVLHDLTGGYDAVIAFSAASVLCAVTPFFAVAALRR
jgi:predicted MFS family arabinose efflux permease